MYGMNIIRAMYSLFIHHCYFPDGGYPFFVWQRDRLGILNGCYDAQEVCIYVICDVRIRTVYLDRIRGRRRNPACRLTD